MHIITDTEYRDTWNNTAEFIVFGNRDDKYIKCFVSRDSVSYKVFDFGGFVGEYDTLAEAVDKYNTLTSLLEE